MKVYMVIDFLGEIVTVKTSFKKALKVKHDMLRESFKGYHVKKLRYFLWDKSLITIKKLSVD